MKNMDHDFEQYFLLALAETSYDERDRLIMELRYGFDGDGPRTLEQVGQVIGVTRERIRQILVRAHRRIRTCGKRQLRQGRTDQAAAQLLLWLDDHIRPSEAGAMERLVEFIETDLAYLPTATHALPLVTGLLQQSTPHEHLDLDAVAAIIAEHERTARQEQKRARRQARLEALLAYTIWPKVVKPISSEGLVALKRMRDVSSDGEGVAGSFQSTKLSRLVQYESRLELGFLLLLEESDDIAYYQEQPLEVPYTSNDKLFPYYPDVLFVLRDGRTVVVEIKPVNFMALRRNLTKWSALRAFCEAKGWGILVTDGHCTIQQVQRRPVDAAFAQAVLRRLQSGPLLWPEYRQLRDQYPVNRNDFLALILKNRLVWHLQPFSLERPLTTG
jgi:hypothetical protein